MLLLLAALATAALHAIGRAASHAGLERHYQANTVRHRRVLSDFTLARRVLRSRAVLPLSALQAAYDEIACLLATHAIGADG